MTLNGEMSLILHYFTEFVYDVVVKQLLVLPPFQNILLIVYHHHRLRGSASPVLTATGFVNGKGQFSTPT